MLQSASIAVLTPRGDVGLGFERSASTFSAVVAIPGNTMAHVCLPRYLFGPGATCKVSKQGTVVDSKTAGALLCLREDLGGGVHSLMMTC
jgi:hypothetical protein